VWVRTQRKAYRNKIMQPLLATIDGEPAKKTSMHKISDLQIAKLQGLGFEWVVGKVRGLGKLHAHEQRLAGHAAGKFCGGRWCNCHQHLLPTLADDTLCARVLNRNRFAARLLISLTIVID